MSLLSISCSDELPPIELQSLWSASGDIMKREHGGFGLLEYPDYEEVDQTWNE